MKTFTQFIAEVKRLRFVKMYHGTSTSSADKIKKSGFNTPEVYASTSKEIARSFGNRKGEDSKVVSFRVPKKDIKNEPPGKVVKTDGQRGVDDWGRKHYSTAMDPDYAKKHISKERPGVIDSPKIGRDFRDRYFKNNPNSRFKRRTKTQPKPKTVEEARRMRVLNLIHSTSRENKKKIQDSGFKDSPSTGSYGQGVYTSPSRRVTRDYGHSDVNLRIVNPEVHSTDSPKDFRSRMKKWITTSSDNDLVKNKNKPVDPRKQAKAAIESGKKIVRVPNAHENPTRNVASGSYVIVDKDTANKSIVKNPQPNIQSIKQTKKNKNTTKKEMKQRTFEEFIQILQEKKISKNQQRKLTKGIVVKPDVERESDGTLRYTLGKPPVPTRPNSQERAAQVAAILDASGAKAIEKELKRRKAAEKARKKQPNNK